MCAYLKARSSQRIIPVTPENSGAAKSWGRRCFFLFIPILPDGSNSMYRLFSPSLPVLKLGTRAISMDEETHKSCCWLKDLREKCCALLPSRLYLLFLHSSHVDVPYGTFLTTSKHLKVPFICLLKVNISASTSKSKQPSDFLRVSIYLCDHIY